MSRWLVGLIGVTSVIVAASLLFGGGSLLWIDATFTDAEGFIQSETVEVEVDGYALVAGPAEIDLEPEIPVGVGELATVRLRVESQSPSQGIFLGVASSPALEAYLGGANYAVIESFRRESFALSYRMSGDDAPAVAPTTIDIWTDSTWGTGEQILDWEVRSGDDSFVVMNETGSEGMSFEASVGARVPFLRPIGVGLLIGGGITLALGTVLLAIAL